MTNYRRYFLQNHPMFITVVTFKRNPILIKNIDLLRESFKESKNRFEYEIIASVILPDHFHILILPKNVKEFPQIITAIKWHFSNNIDDSQVKNVKKYLTPTAIKREEKGVWQRRYNDHIIRNDKDLFNHLDYIHYNPVKHGHTNKVKDWQYSSFDKFVKRGNYELNWGSHDDVNAIVGWDYE